MLSRAKNYFLSHFGSSGRGVTMARRDWPSTQTDGPWVCHCLLSDWCSFVHMWAVILALIHAAFSSCYLSRPDTLQQVMLPPWMIALFRSHSNQLSNARPHTWASSVRFCCYATPVVAAPAAAAAAMMTSRWWWWWWSENNYLRTARLEFALWSIWLWWHRWIYW